MKIKFINTIGLIIMCTYTTRPGTFRINFACSTVHIGGYWHLLAVEDKIHYIACPHAYKRGPCIVATLRDRFLLEH